MSPKLTAEEQAIRDQVGESELVLGRLTEELRGIDAEMEALAEAHPTYAVLERACQSLQELDEIGAGDLFWDGQDDERGDRIAFARRQLDEYHAEIGRVEGRRESVLTKIDGQNVELDYLHYDLQDILEQQEAENSEWVIERDEPEIPYRALVMPWTRGCQEDQRFKRSLASSLATAIAVVMIISMIAIPVRDRATEIELPERMAKLVRQERTPPPPPLVSEPEIPEEMPEPDASPELVEDLPDEPMPASADGPQLAEAQPDTREQVKSKGILAFRDSFASRADVRPTARLGSQASISSAGGDSVGRPERMMVTTSAQGSSGGINLSNISRDFGGGGGAGGGNGDGIGGVQIARVSSSIGGGSGPDRPLSGGAMAGRTDEEIQIVFDRYKAALYRLYNRELRKDPTLRGQLVLRLTIEPDGSVSLCELHSTNMDAPLLADQVVTRVGTFDFGAKEDIVAITIIYPIDFLPAA